MHLVNTPYYHPYYPTYPPIPFPIKTCPSPTVCFYC